MSMPRSPNGARPSSSRGRRRSSSGSKPIARGGQGAYLLTSLSPTRGLIGMPRDTEPLTLLQDLVGRARKAGADAADAVFAEGISVSLAQRLGAPEKLERAEGQDLGLRVLVGKRQAIVSSTDFRPSALRE